MWDHFRPPKQYHLASFSTRNSTLNTSLPKPIRMQDFCSIMRFYSKCKYYTFLHFESNVFLFPRWKTPSSLTSVAPRTIAPRDFIHHIGLKFNRRLKPGGSEFLLKGLVRSSNNVNSVLSKKTCEGFYDTTDIRKADHGGGFIFNQSRVVQSPIKLTQG